MGLAVLNADATVRRGFTSRLRHQLRDKPLGSHAATAPAATNAAIERFPDQNPNPVLRFDDSGHLTYANEASRPVLNALKVGVGEKVPPAHLANLRKAAAQPGVRLEIVDSMRTFALLPVHVPDLGFTNVYGTEVTAEKVIERFPNQNPNPVFRINDEGELIYANPASQALIEAHGMRVGDRWSDAVARPLLAAVDSESDEPIEILAGLRTYALRPVRVAEYGFITVYGTDITAEKVVAKFPGQNPNPVLRMTPGGELIYANPASATLVEALDLQVGRPLPEHLLNRLMESLASGRILPIECPARDRIFELLPVLIEEFGFVNIYGTDVTAVRELGRARDEIERLLLNILPPPIADRLRRGEQVIADRFDDATLLIADIVGFTTLASGLEPDQLVILLNDLFRTFDALVDKHGLEKIKTIGDAYMVIGGVPTHSDDHVERVADFALDMASALVMGPEARRVSMRIGMHCGPVVAGVIGAKRTIYDVWGDTVNIASRMESLGAPDRVHTSSGIHERLKGRYTFEDRGVIEVKGKGEVSTYFLTGKRAS